MVKHKQIGLFVFILGAVLASSGCGKDEPVMKNDREDIILSTRAEILGEAGKDFAFDMLRKVNEMFESKEYLFSPFSMQMILGMIVNASEGKTREELCSAMGYGESGTDEINSYAKTLLSRLPDMDKNSSLKLGNVAVVHKAYSPTSGFCNALNENYFAEVKSEDLRDNSAAIQNLDRFVTEKTDGKITSLNVRSLPNNCNGLVVNALYFKGEWTSKFDPKMTRDSDFFLENGSAVKIKMMMQKGEFKRRDTELYSAVSLPFGNEAFNMAIVIPADKKTLYDVVEGFGKDDLKALSSSEKSILGVMIPKFDAFCSADYKGILQGLGIKSAFNYSAELKNMFGETEWAPFIESVIQDVKISVDENGSEVSAITTALMGMDISSGKEYFYADEPFLYFITEQSTGTILLAGKFTGLR